MATLQNKDSPTQTVLAHAIRAGTQTTPLLRGARAHRYSFIQTHTCLHTF